VGGVSQTQEYVGISPSVQESGQAWPRGLFISQTFNGSFEDTAQKVYAPELTMESLNGALNDYTNENTTVPIIFFTPIKPISMGSFISQFPTHLILETMQKSFMGMKLTLLS
jgi:hypothetical protein